MLDLLDVACIIIVCYYYNTAYLRGVLKNIPNYFHWRIWWKDVGISDHEFFQNIVLDCTSQLILVYTLIFNGKILVILNTDKLHEHTGDTYYFFAWQLNVR